MALANYLIEQHHIHPGRVGVSVLGGNSLASKLQIILAYNPTR